MSPAYEAFLVRLYTDDDARARFLVDPPAEASRGGLTIDEAAAIVQIDRTGLELAARSYAAKRRSRRDSAR